MLSEMRVVVTGKRDPVRWVKEARRKHSKEELRQLLGKLAANEAASYTFESGKRMGNRAFWRNAKAYFDRNVK